MISYVNMILIFITRWRIYNLHTYVTLHETFTNKSFVGFFFDGVISDVDVTTQEVQSIVSLRCYCNAQIFGLVHMFELVSMKSVGMVDDISLAGDVNNFALLWMEFHHPCILPVRQGV